MVGIIRFARWNFTVPFSVSFFSVLIPVPVILNRSPASVSCLFRISDFGFCFVLSPAHAPILSLDFRSDLQFLALSGALLAFIRSSGQSRWTVLKYRSSLDSPLSLSANWPWSGLFSFGLSFRITGLPKDQRLCARFTLSDLFSLPWYAFILAQ